MLVRLGVGLFKLPIIITNSSNNFGYHQNKEKLIPKKTILSILKGKKIPIFTSGNQVRNWIFVEDNVNAIFKIIKGVIGQSYNIGSKTELSNIKLVKLICYELSKKYKNYTYQNNLGLIKHVRDRPGHDKKYSINVKKLQKLGWVERADFIKKPLKKL